MLHVSEDGGTYVHIHRIQIPINSRVFFPEDRGYIYVRNVGYIACMVQISKNGIGANMDLQQDRLTLQEHCVESHLLC
jgi:hypothetical protein